MLSRDQTPKRTIVGLTPAELTDLFTAWGEPSFRARQLFNWLYARRVDDYQAMTNLPKALRDELEEKTTVHALSITTVTGSAADSARKFLFRLASGEHIEAVLMQESGRITACLSTQVGCALDCAFCATAKMGFRRNLTVGEIVDQFLLLQQQISDRITNVVFMGMGEPFLNYRRVIGAAELLNHPDGIALSARKITISTVGIIPQIRRFTAERQRYKLAVSLNGTTQEQRQKIMPIARKYPLKQLIAAVQSYAAHTAKYPTFEYVLIDRFNDSRADASRLIELLTGLPCKVNVIPYNEIGGDFRRPSPERIERFVAALYQAPFTVTVRWSRGTDINAGCGQLATQPHSEVA
jgi:23S rRNA (adenine2503-C2)-methyltransferase